ncbi:ABC transporter permease [Kordiimonas sp.]|uniref:ABC transporter permease n=1 Tax=Kordiimonas sp. TaxID=1970157 RepID=UPI003A92BE9C
MNAQILTVYRKEMRDMVRDKRALIAILSYVLGVPVMFAFLFFLMSDDRGENVKSSVAIDGMAQAPGLVAYLERDGYEVVDAADEDTAIAPENIPQGADAFLVLEADYSAALKEGRQAKALLYVDETSRVSTERGEDIRSAILSYGNHVAGIRVISRGVPVGLLSPISLSLADISKTSFINKVMGNMLMLIFALAPFVVGLSVALDALAGEREKQSLATLMAQPISGMSLTLGKWAMVATFGLVGTVATATLNLVTISFLPPDLLPFALKVTVPGLLMAGLQVATLCMFVASLQMAVSIHAKSFKEGQTYMSMMMIVPVFVGYSKIYGESKLPGFVNYLPIFSDMESLSSIFFDGVINPQVTGSAIMAGLAGTALCLMLTSKRLSSEHMIADS